MTNTAELTAEQMGRAIDEKICAERGVPVRYQQWQFISYPQIKCLYERLVGQGAA